MRLAVACLLARGHLLLEDLPGVGKTTLALALARVLGLEFGRVQFTSDLLPTDILGVSVLDVGAGSLSFRPGPVFHQVVLADEINRATPKTQSALLEAMAEGQVSVEGRTHPLPQPLLRDRHAEPRRALRDLPAARVAARPLHDDPAHGLPRARRRAGPAREPRHPRARRPRRPGARPRGRARRSSSGRPRCRSPRRCWSTCSTSRPRRATPGSCSSASRRAARSTGCAPPRPAPCSPGAPTASPRTCRGWPRPWSPTACSRAGNSSGSTVPRSSGTSSAAVPVR